MNTPNWKHNSGKAKKGKGVCKGVLRARRQSLKALRRRIDASQVSVGHAE